jgi:hypothetical protein
VSDPNVLASLPIKFLMLCFSSPQSTIVIELLSRAE